MSICDNCKAPLSTSCPCDECAPRFERTYCHICVQLNRIIFRSPYFSKLHTAWKEEQAARKNRMGLQ